MTTIKVKFHPPIVAGKAGTSCYRITHRQAVWHIATDMPHLPAGWGDSRYSIIPIETHASGLHDRDDSAPCLLQSAIGSRDLYGATYSADHISKPFHPSETKSSVLAFMQEQIDQLRGSNRLGTANNYERAMRSFSRFLCRDIPLADVTEQLVESYNAFLLQRGIMRNSVSFYMRILRATYNKAVRRHMTVQTTPFQNVYTGIDRTRKRAIDEKLIVRLYKLPLPQETPLAMTRDLFIFSYCTRGMSFVDIAYLKKNDIQNGVIHYIRRKTGQLLSVRIEPNIGEIIERYTSHTLDSPYVFPILKSSEAEETYRQYRTAINTYNRQLKELSGLISTNVLLTSYSARHSWATNAHRHNAPVSVISAGLGHSSEKTTRIYLAALENPAIDSVNQLIVSRLSE